MPDASPARRARSLGIAAVLALGSARCGPPAYLPLSVEAPAPLDSATARIGALQVRLRRGAEWLEVRLTNGGAAPLAVDLDGTTLTLEGAAPQSLIDVDRLVGPWRGGAGGRGNASPVVEGRNGGWSAGGLHRVVFSVDERVDARDGRPLDVAADLTPRPDPVVLRAGDAADALLVAVDRVRLQADGGATVGPLLDARGPTSVQSDTLTRWIALTIPLRVGGVWRDAMVVARIAAARGGAR